MRRRTPSPPPADSRDTSPSALTAVYYHLPTDQDDPEHPNAFTIPKPASEIKLRDVKLRFPLPGSYHFRFKLKYKTSHVWIDVSNDDSRVPLFNSKVIAKVLRVTWSLSDIAPSNGAVSPNPKTTKASRRFSLSAEPHDPPFPDNSSHTVADQTECQTVEHPPTNVPNLSDRKSCRKSESILNQDMLLFDTQPRSTGNDTNSKRREADREDDLDMLFG